jgi:hypothetical protein
LQATQARDAKQRAEAETRRKAEAEKRAANKLPQRPRPRQSKPRKNSGKKAAAAQAARKKSEREAELRRQLAMEEEGEAVAQSGVTNEYVALLVQTIERKLEPVRRRPRRTRVHPACHPGYGGTVIDVKIGDCNGDQAVRESVANARVSFLPLACAARPACVPAPAGHRFQAHGVAPSMKFPRMPPLRPLQCFASLLVVGLVGWASAAQAQLRPGTLRRACAMPCRSPWSRSAGRQRAVRVDVAAVIANDLRLSGRFAPLERTDLVARPTTGSVIRFEDWRVLRSDFIVVGRLEPAGTGQAVTFELFNVQTGQQLLTQRLTTSEEGDARHGSPDRRPGLRAADRHSRRVLDANSLCFRGRPDPRATLSSRRRRRPTAMAAARGDGVE